MSSAANNGGLPLSQSVGDVFVDSRLDSCAAQQQSAGSCDGPAAAAAAVRLIDFGHGIQITSARYLRQRRKSIPITHDNRYARNSFMGYTDIRKRICRAQTVLVYWL